MFSLGLQTCYRQWSSSSSSACLPSGRSRTCRIPEAVAKLLALYSCSRSASAAAPRSARSRFDGTVAVGDRGGIVLSFAIPFIAYALLRAATGLGAMDAAAIAGHYGSISAVTFAAVTGMLTELSVPYDGYLVAVAAAMETPRFSRRC